MASLAYASQPSIALFYGQNLPWDELNAFDIVVVEPQHVPDPTMRAGKKTALFAYVSVGEAHSDRPYLKLISDDWKLGSNADWGSIVLDQSKAEWPAFFVEQIIKPLWDAGYHGFFLDTLDSYQLYAKTEADRAQQEAGLVAVIQALRKRYPEARLIFNRGFEILPRLHQEVYAVAAESLFQGWSAGQKAYRAVSPQDREWLLGQLNKAKQTYGLPVLSIDYVSPGNRALARETANKIRALGFIPWVSNPELDMLGVGEIEVMPRKILMIQNVADSEFDLDKTSALNFGTMPLNYLGYTVEYLDARRPLPDYTLTGRYAGIVVWLDKTAGIEGNVLSAWLKKQISDGNRVVVLGENNFLFSSDFAKNIGLQLDAVITRTSRLHVSQRDPLIGFESEPFLDRASFFSLHAIGGTPLLTLADEHGNSQEVVALTPWGGYALTSNILVERPRIWRKPGDEDDGKNLRWVINPIDFLRRALNLPDMPVPDVTTESGRRLLMVHMDGDGFANKAEFPGSPYAAEVLRDRILKKYLLPATISVIQGEVAADGLYPALSPVLEKIARDIFALPQVEIASHSYSHPFSWRKVEAGMGESGYNLPIPNYHFDLKSEIPGSIAYIESHLAPAGKRVKVFLWTGDCNPGADAVELAELNGVFNMNGGDTIITRSLPSLTLVAPLGVMKKGHFQIYAPNQNENAYTNNWRGPFYGFERVIETFELTETPYRLKPINIYFHTYAASKPASLKSLYKIFNWARAQETTPVYTSDYIRKVLDFNRLVVARTPDGWLVRGAENLHELRTPVTLGQPELKTSKGVAGFNRHGDNLYLHLAQSEAEIRFGKTITSPPYLVSANARIENLVRSNSANGLTLGFTLRGDVPLKFDLALAARCTVHADGRAIKPDASKKNIARFSMNKHVVDELRIFCPR